MNIIENEFAYFDLIDDSGAVVASCYSPEPLERYKSQLEANPKLGLKETK